MSENQVILEISDLHAEYVNPQNEAEPIPILKGLSISLQRGLTHAVMGPNGSGKSTLSYVLMGHPHYRITGGDIRLLNEETGALESIMELETHERAQKGLFLSFQSPVSVPGLPVTQFLRNSLKSIRGREISVKEFRKELRASMEALEMSPDFTKRYLNEGFSGGEKKRMEILQMSLIQPRVAILDEIDSGLDIDALRLVSEGINQVKNDTRSLLLITHYKRLLDYVPPSRIHILADGRIIQEGGPELADILEKDGYDKILQNAQAGRT